MNLNFIEMLTILQLRPITIGNSYDGNNINSYCMPQYTTANGDQLPCNWYVSCFDFHQL